MSKKITRKNWPDRMLNWRGWNEPEVCFCSGFLNGLRWGGGSFEIKNVSGVRSLKNQEDHLWNPVTRPREVKIFAQGHTACWCIVSECCFLPYKRICSERLLMWNLQSQNHMRYTKLICGGGNQNSSCLWGRELIGREHEVIFRGAGTISWGAGLFYILIRVWITSNGTFKICAFHSIQILPQY